MKHKTTKEFWQFFNGLPRDVKEQAQKQFELLKENPWHHSLFLKESKTKKDIWSARVNKSYRAISIKTEDTHIWYWIGTHGPYEKEFS